MGVINVQGIGAVQIEGDTPNEAEIESFQRFASVRKEGELLDGPAGEAADSFIKSPSFGRIVTEVGLAIGGSVLTGGLALPALGARVGLLARPFLTQLAKSSAGAAAGGGTGALVSQTFDPKEDVVREIVRASMEGALGEAIGAPLVIKGGQVMGKLLGSSNPKKYNSLLKGAEEAEIALQAKSVQILKGMDSKKFIDLGKTKAGKIKQQAILKEIQSKGFKLDESFATKYAAGKGIDDPKDVAKIIETAKEMAKGLTPGVKASNRTIEIMENIAQKSLIGGGGITKRYAAAKDIGNFIAEDVFKDFRVAADSADLGVMFFENLAGSKAIFKATTDRMYKNASKILKDSGMADANIIPANKIRSSLEGIQSKYSESVGAAVLPQVLKSLNTIRQADGMLSFEALSKTRNAFSDLAEQLGTYTKQGRDAKSIVKEIDLIFKDADGSLAKILPKDAIKALKEADQFYEAGADIFNRGLTGSLIKAAASDGTLLGKDAMAVQTVFQKAANGDKFASIKQIFRELDALTGKTVNKDGTFRALTPLYDPQKLAQGVKVPMLSVKQADELKQAFRGQYISNALDKAATGEAQFGKFFDAGKFSKEINKGEGKVRRFLFDGANKGKLMDLERTLQFAQGDLSRLPGIPGGIFIQLKQAGAAGQILSFGGIAGSAGLAGATLGLVPALSILLAPAVASKMLLNPKFSNLLFKETTKLIVKGENTPSKMSVVYRQILGRMVGDGLITEQEYENQMSQLDKFGKEYSEGETQTDQVQNTENIVDQSGIPLPNFNPTNFPVISGSGAQGAVAGNAGAAAAVAGNDPLLTGIAANRMRVGGIVNAKKIN